MSGKQIAEKAKSKLQKKTAGAADEKANLSDIVRSPPATMKGLAPLQIGELLGVYRLQLANILPEHLSAERILALYSLLIRKNPDIAQCSTQSLIGAMLQCSVLGFEPLPELKRVAFIPRQNKGVWELEFTIMYRGWLDLAYRSGLISSIRARIVHENDQTEIVMGTEEKLTHIPDMISPGKAIWAYSVIDFLDGKQIFTPVSGQDILKRRNHSDSYRSDVERLKKDPSGRRYSPWSNWEKEMWLKTALKYALERYAPIEIERRIYQVEQVDEKVIAPDMLTLTGEKIESVPEAVAETSNNF